MTAGLRSVALVMAASVGMARGPAEAPLKLERTIELPDVRGRIDHMSVDPGTRRLFVAALGNDTVEVVDVAAGKRIHTIRGLAEPQGALVVPQQGRLYVANARDGSLRLFDASSFVPLRTVSLGADADNVRLDAATGHVWVGYGEGGLAAVDADGRKLADVRLPAHPESFQLEASGRRIFVNVPDAGTVAVVDRGKAAVVARWGTGQASANFPMALDEAHERLFVVCRAPARLLVLNTDSGSAVAELPSVGDADDVWYDARARRVYVSGGEGAIVVYGQDDPDHYRAIARLSTVAGARTSLFSPDLRRLFVAAPRQGPRAAAVRVYAVVD